MLVLPITRAATGRANTLRGLLSDPRLVKADPYTRLGVVWRTDARTRARRFLPFDLGRVLRGQADLPLAELKQRSLVNDRAKAADKDLDFSRRIRAGLPGIDQ